MQIDHSPISCDQATCLGDEMVMPNKQWPHLEQAMQQIHWHSRACTEGGSTNLTLRR